MEANPNDLNFGKHSHLKENLNAINLISLDIN